MRKSRNSDMIQGLQMYQHKLENKYLKQSGTTYCKENLTLYEIQLGHVIDDGWKNWALSYKDTNTLDQVYDRASKIIFIGKTRIV